MSRLITKLKGERFVLDEDIPVGYVISLVFSRIIALIYGMWVVKGIRMVFIHPSSVVKCRSKLQFGKNLTIDRGCFIDALSRHGVVMGNNVSIGKFTTLECTGSLKQLGYGIVIGNNVGLGTRGHYGCAGGIKIGDDTIIGNYVSIHSENHIFSSLDVPIRMQGVSHKGIVIGQNCWIGAKVTILDGSMIGDGCVVAAGSVVRGNIPSNSVIGGIPAKILKKRTDEITC